MYTIDPNIRKAVDAGFEACKELADYITDNPELGGGERLACAKYMEFLRAAGYELTSPVAGEPHSFLAVKKERVHDSGPRAVLMCEYDALPEIGHACGHSISGAASLLAATAINSLYPDFPIRLDIMGTPGEEYPGGKVHLSAKGAFESYAFAAMVHMFGGENTPAFEVLACNDRLITFKGKSAHASGQPWEGLNALNAARLFMDAMDMWRQHLPLYSQIHGIVTKGGDLPSIVPDHVELNYYFRAKNMNELKHLNKVAETCVDAAAMATSTTGSWVQQYDTYADLSNREAAVLLVEEVMDAMGLKHHRFTGPQGSTDAGNVDQIIPVFHAQVDATGGQKIPLHDAAFAEMMKRPEGYAGLKNGALLLASLVHRLAFEPELLEKIQSQHKAYRGI